MKLSFYRGCVGCVLTLLGGAILVSCGGGGGGGGETAGVPANPLATILERSAAVKSLTLCAALQSIFQP